MNLLWTALIMGLAGSMHCLIMCGPIIMSLPQKRGFNKLLASRFVHNFGRLLSYLLIGLVFGSIGAALGLMPYQNLVSILSGSILVLAVLPTILKSRKSIFGGFFLRWSQVSSKFMAYFKKQNKGVATLGFGIVNGLLPCGLVYVAAAASIHATSLTYSLTYMLFFWLGTLPMMMGIGLFSHIIKPAFRARFRKAVPYLALFMGVIFILRGFSLNIPYLSPTVSKTSKGEIENCCHK